MDIAKAVLHVIHGHLTAVTKRARREIKILKPSSESAVFRLAPDLEQIFLPNISHKVFLGLTLAISQVMFMGV